MCGVIVNMSTSGDSNAYLSSFQTTTSGVGTSAAPALLRQPMLFMPSRRYFQFQQPEKFFEKYS